MTVIYTSGYGIENNYIIGGFIDRVVDEPPITVSLPVYFQLLIVLSISLSGARDDFLAASDIRLDGDFARLHA